MAVKPGELYSGQIDTDATNYPHGKARNESVSGANNGTPLEKQWVNDIWGFFAALLAAGGVTPSGSPDTAVASQYLQAIQALIANQSNKILRVGNPYGSAMNQAFTGAAGSPVAFTNGNFTVTGVGDGQTIQVDFYPIFVDNTASSSDCHVLVQYQNGGSWTTCADYIIPQSTSRSFCPIAADVGLASGNVSFRLVGYNNSVNNASVKSLETTSYLARWKILKQ